LQTEVKNNSNKSIKTFQNLSFEFYNLLFPKDVISELEKAKIETIIIIPDDRLATIPFEALLTKKYDAKWTGWNNKEYFSNMPYLLKKYNVSYNYSANLFYKTFKKKKQNKIKITELNDWLAFAPIFDDEDISGTTIKTRNLLKNAATDSSGIGNSRAFLNDGTHISPLPGSELETKSIFNIFEKNNKKAVLKTHKFANESFVKSGELAKYRYLHFATHGIVNADKPELSAIILAQDSSNTEDNILYSGEIYNLKINADLTVLSACETGLGKISTGEGVIGLTRALLYAGSKNIIVSLWQVSDASTNKLMVNFYDNFLNVKTKKSKKLINFSKHLQQAKLELINESKFAHPYFWSPFILVGK